jgi:hypothetical protein
MKNSSKSVQYTLRNIPDHTDRILRERAGEYGISLNQAALEALGEGLGIRGEVLHHDFDAYAGSWVADEAVEEALQDQERIDEGMWE